MRCCRLYLLLTFCLSFYILSALFQPVEDHLSSVGRFSELFEIINISLACQLFSCDELFLLNSKLQPVDKIRTALKIKTS